MLLQVSVLALILAKRIDKIKYENRNSCHHFKYFTAL